MPRSTIEFFGDWRFAPFAATRLFGRDAMNRLQNHVEGGIASVYDRHGYSEENKRIMEAVAQKIMMLVEGGDGTANVLPFARQT